MAALLAACDQNPRLAPPSGSAATTATLAVDTIASGLSVPWALAFAADGRIFVTERGGRIRVIERGHFGAEPWAMLPVAEQGEAGLRGLALSPDFADSHELFVVGTFDQDGALVNRVVRLTEENGRGVRRR